MALKILFRLRDSLMWEQYEFVVTTDLVQTETELGRAKESLEIANMAIMDAKMCVTLLMFACLSLNYMMCQEI